MGIGRKTLLVLLSIILLTGCTPGTNMTEVLEMHGQTEAQAAVQKKWNYEFHYGIDYWEYYDLSDSFISTREDYERLVGTYIPQIEKLIGIEDWYIDYNQDADTIVVNLEMGSISISYAYQTTKGADHTIEFSQLLSLKQIASPIDRVLPHELTHSLLGTGKCFSNSLEEGICDYVCTRLGTNYCDFYEQCGIDIMDMLYCGTNAALEKQYDEEKADKMLDSIGRATGYTYSLQTDDGIIWYSCSQCFVEYLVKNYGMEKTIRLIRDGKSEEDYQLYLGVRYDQLKKDWITTLRTYEPKYTAEEYTQILRSFLETFQSP